jgi:hypothetical protein
MDKPEGAPTSSRLTLYRATPWVLVSVGLVGFVAILFH